MRINRLKFITIMAKRELSAKSLAQKAGLSHNTICGIRAGRSCAEETAQSIAKALNVPLDILINHDSEAR
jgi:Helix-turn-helix.